MRSHTLYKAGITAALFMVFSAAGCGSARRVYPVEGTVLFQDETPARELAGGTVSFESALDRSNASAEIRPDGTFRLKNQQGADGVPAGTYRVLVLPPEPLDADRPPPPVIDPRYHSYDTSEIEVTVQENVNTLPIKLQRLRGGKAN